MEREVGQYKGLDNRDLKMLSRDAWEIPLLLKNPLVKEIMSLTKDLEPGEIKRVYKGDRPTAVLLQSSLWRLMKKHKMGIKVFIRTDEIYLQKKDGD